LDDVAVSVHLLQKQVEMIEQVFLDQGVIIAREGRRTRSFYQKE
jgi:hypothetical protein